MKLKRSCSVKFSFIAVVFTLCAIFASGFAWAEKLSGKDAIKAVIGKTVVFQVDGDDFVLKFASEFDVLLKRPAPMMDEVKGSVSTGDDRSKICLTFRGVIPSQCFQLDLEGDKFVMTKRGGEQTIAVVTSGRKQKQKVAATPAAEGDPRFCKPLRAMAESALGKSRLSSLVVPGSAPINLSDVEGEGRDEIYPSTIELGHCFVDPNGIQARHNCMIPMEPTDPEAEKLYVRLNKQIKLCLGEKIFSTRVSKSIITGREGDGRKIASSTYTLKEKIELSVVLSDLGRCSELSMVGCDFQYGVYVNITDRC